MSGGVDPIHIAGQLLSHDVAGHSNGTMLYRVAQAVKKLVSFNQLCKRPPGPSVHVAPEFRSNLDSELHPGEATYVT